MSWSRCCSTPSGGRRWVGPPALGSGSTARWRRSAERYLELYRRLGVGVTTRAAGASSVSTSSARDPTSSRRRRSSRRSAPWASRQRLVHTGQHYDPRLSDVFFHELGLPAAGREPRRRARARRRHQTGGADDRARGRVRGAPARHGRRLRRRQLDARRRRSSRAKLHIPLAHVEAGLRSFDLTMPEEVNRRVTDLLLRPALRDQPGRRSTTSAARASTRQRVHFVGNPMIDTLLAHLDRFDARARSGAPRLPGRYAVATLHRPANVDTPAAAARLVARAARGAQSGSRSCCRSTPAVVPRSKRPASRGARPLGSSNRSGTSSSSRCVRGAAVVVTDSGGMQEETTVLACPASPLRPNTERPITITPRHEPARRARRTSARLVDAALERHRRRRRGRRSGTGTPASASPPSWPGSW